MAAEQRDKLERLARYVSRPPVSVERLDLQLDSLAPSRARRSRFCALGGPLVHWYRAKACATVADVLRDLGRADPNVEG